MGPPKARPPKVCLLSLYPSKPTNSSFDGVAGTAVEHADYVNQAIKAEPSRAEQSKAKHFFSVHSDEIMLTLQTTLQGQGTTVSKSKKLCRGQTVTLISSRTRLKIDLHSRLQRL